MKAYTVEQVAEMLHIGRDKVYYLLRTGQLRSIKIGKIRRITDQHLAEFIATWRPTTSVLHRIAVWHTVPRHLDRPGRSPWP